MHAGQDDHTGDDLASPSDGEAPPRLDDTSDHADIDPPDPADERPDEMPDGTPEERPDATADELPDEGVSVDPPTTGIESDADADTDAATDSDAPLVPMLPHMETTTTPPTMMATVATPTRGGDTWYRTDQDRFRSVHRRANPWYRRLARGVIGVAFLTAAGIGLFFAARLVQDYLDRDRLPSQGADVPTIRATSFEIRSTAPAPQLDGTLTLDAATRAFEFVGRGSGSQAGVQVVSPDGVEVYTRVGSGSWQRAVGTNPIVSDVVRAVEYLADDDSADDILTTELRRGYVDLIERVEIGSGDDELRRYDVRIDTRSFEAASPLQYQLFEDEALPGVPAVRGLVVSITLDRDDVLVAVDDAGSNWSWQRLTYSGEPFAPIDPADTIVITDGTTVDDSSEGG